MHASSIGFNIGLNGVPEFWPNVITSDQVNSPVLSKMSSDRVVVIVL